MEFGAAPVFVVTAPPKRKHDGAEFVEAVLEAIAGFAVADSKVKPERRF